MQEPISKCLLKSKIPHILCTTKSKNRSVTYTLYTCMVYAHSTPHFLCRYYCNAGRPKNYPQCRPQSSPMPILGCGHLYTTLLINSASARRALCRCCRQTDWACAATLAKNLWKDSFWQYVLCRCFFVGCVMRHRIEKLKWEYGSKESCQSLCKVL